MDYKTIAANKCAHRQSQIPKEWLVSPETVQNATNLMEVPVTCGVLNDVECEITSKYDATALLEKLRAGIWSVEQVVVAFCKRAAITQQLTNCLTEIFFDQAIERARLLDARRQENPENILPPLYGLPVSLKDSFQVFGQDTSTGLACYINEPATEHSATAAMLLDLGAVLYCKTNLPQFIMSGDSDNNVFGRTLNPRNVNLTAGGSTGGEGALLALRGSILGVGTDIGGSIRVPAVCNGLYGFRPSVGLVPHGGVRDVTVPGTDGVRSSAGPMATSIRDCSLLLKTIMQAGTWKYDSTAVSIPWINLRVKERLRIGLVENDGLYTPTPPVRRVINKAADLLRKRDDVEIISITLPNLKECYQDLISYYTISGSEYYQEQVGRTGEPVIPSMQATGLMSLPGKTLKDFFDLNVRRAEAAKVYQALFRDNNLDAILMPPAPHTAVPLDSWMTITYTAMWNYLDYPAIVIPMDHVREEDVKDNNAKFGPADEKYYSMYTGPEDYKEMPVCVQLVGYKHTDEAFINTAVVVDSVLNGSS